MDLTVACCKCDSPVRFILHSLILFVYYSIPLLRRKSKAPKEVKDREPTAREIRAQLIQKHVEKEALEKEQKRSLAILASAAATEPVKEPSTEEALADDSTENTPGNSDQEEDVTVNDDEPTSSEGVQQLPSSPISILSANTKPALIHPPLSLVRQPVEEGEETPEPSKAPHCGLLCGCI